MHREESGWVDPDPPRIYPEVVWRSSLGGGMTEENVQEENVQEENAQKENAVNERERQDRERAEDNRARQIRQGHISNEEEESSNRDSI